MKKSLFVFTVAAVALTACTNETSEYVGSGPEAKEIAFSPLTQPSTRTAVQGTAFPTTYDMEVVAYQSDPKYGDTPAGYTYFSKSTFSRNEITTGVYKWKDATTPHYWPLSEVTLNFFAVTGANAADISIADNLATASVSYKTASNPSSTTYSNADQKDIMYSFKRASVTKSSNTLTFPDVPMVFQHALALINFQIKGSTGITVNRITLDNARYTGSLAIANSGDGLLNKTGDVTTTLTWEGDDVVDHVDVPNIKNHALDANFYPDGTSVGQTDWAALMIIPGASYGFESFTIHYTYNGKSYSYTYAPTWVDNDNDTSTPDVVSVTAVSADTKYTYQITMTLHEILVAPTVDNWTTSAATGVTIP